MKKIVYIVFTFVLAACLYKPDIETKGELILLDISVEEGENPSFLDLKISASSSQEILDIMNKYPYFREGVDPNPIKRKENDDLKYHYLIDGVMGDSISFILKNDTLQRITIDPSYLELKEVLAEFGEPNYLYTTEWETPRGWDRGMFVLYPDIGLLVSVACVTQNKELFVSEGSRVIVLHLHSIENIRSWYAYHISLTNPYLNNPSDYLYEWKGYGKLSDLYPNIIRSEN